MNVMMVLEEKGATSRILFFVRGAGLDRLYQKERRCSIKRSEEGTRSRHAEIHYVKRRKRNCRDTSVLLASNVHEESRHTYFFTRGGRERGSPVWKLKGKLAHLVTGKRKIRKKKKGRSWGHLKKSVPMKCHIWEDEKNLPISL